MSQVPVFFSVVIVNFNAGPHLQAALTSLASQTERDFEVILIDNASTDGSADSLDTTGLPAFTLVKASDNLGFAGANNKAAGLAHGRWLALLNPDATAEPDWLEQVRAGIEHYRDTPSFACTQIAADDPSRLDGAGDNFLVFGIPWRGGYRRPVSDLPPEGECFSACGASAIYLKSTFLEMNGFDERFFCYCEDVDLGYRLRLAGNRCIFLPGARVHHLGGGSADQISGFAIRLGTRNRLWLFIRDTPLGLLVLTLPVHLILTLLILVRGLSTGRFRWTLTGIAEAIRGLPEFWSERKLLHDRRQASSRHLVRMMAFNPMRILTCDTFVRPSKP